MPIASNSTKLKPSDALDTRPEIFGREVTSTFKQMPSFKHQPPGNMRTCMIPPVVFGSLLFNLPRLLKLRFFLKKERKKQRKTRGNKLWIYRLNKSYIN